MTSDEQILETLEAQLGDWAAQIDNVVTREPDAVVVADRGGEIRFSVRSLGDEFAVSRAERSEDEELQIIVFDLDDVVRFLTVQLGTSIRVSRGLRISTMWLPITVTELAPNANIEEVPPRAVGGQPLMAVVIDGQRKALFPFSPNPFRAVEYSHYTGQPVELIRESFLHPSGAPLFEKRASA